MTEHQKAVTAIHRDMKTERRYTVYLAGKKRERRVEMSESDLVAVLQEHFKAYVIEMEIETIEVGKTRLEGREGPDLPGPRVR